MSEQRPSTWVASAAHWRRMSNARISVRREPDTTRSDDGLATLPRGRCERPLCRAIRCIIFCVPRTVPQSGRRRAGMLPARYTREYAMPHPMGHADSWIESHGVCGSPGADRSGTSRLPPLRPALHRTDPFLVDAERNCAYAFSTISRRSNGCVRIPNLSGSRTTSATRTAGRWFSRPGRTRDGSGDPRGRGPPA